ncbi:MAG: RNA methyltransferase [Bacteroidaceae bacterium]|nr:RNA methyltransferase [Bacteroidaceae bacterium]
MLTKNQIKFIQSLSRKKGRVESGCFIAEGNKLVEDTLHAFVCRMLVATPQWWQEHPTAPAEQRIEVARDELSRISQLTTPQEVLAVYEIPQKQLDEKKLKNELSIVLDTVQDPGNLGTIIRIADWMGIRNIVCSHETADVYNPKVVQATMGALARVALHYTQLETFMEQVADSMPIYGTFLDGENIYQKPLSSHGLIVMGNEGNGISHALEHYISHRLYIPNFPPGAATSESLNVAVATAITCAEFRRREIMDVKK